VARLAASCSECPSRTTGGPVPHAYPIHDAEPGEWWADRSPAPVEDDNACEDEDGTGTCREDDLSAKLAATGDSFREPLCTGCFRPGCLYPCRSRADRRRERQWDCQ
jgi:hypothetical protein